jgi:cysteine desulfurase/selenocysteine lyase
VHRGLHFLSNAATDAYESAREKVRHFLNAESVERSSSRNRDRGDQPVAYGYGMPHIGEGDEIVLSIMEHHSNIVPWHFHPRTAGREAEMGPRRRRRCV